MDTLFVAIHAKYLHTSPAVRILHQVTKQSYRSHFIEMGMKDRFDTIIESITSYTPKVVGFSCYIWNIELILQLAKQVKRILPNTIILLGGPEVSYQTQFFLEDPAVDYILAGEGEEAIVPFLDSLFAKKEIMMSGVASKAHPYTSYRITQDLNHVPSIIDTYNEEDFARRILYYETSRGCPFHCSYCLSSIEQGVRLFDEKRIKDELSTLIQKGARTIKFLDRTFNLQPKRFLSLVQFLEQFKGTNTFQFEITLDLFTEELMEYFTHQVEPNLFRFEIGIQSIHSIVNEAVDRYQNQQKLTSYIKRLLDGKRVTLHLDLIAGLPYETYPLFQQTFSETIALFPNELQLGFLKMLRGTKIRKEATRYGYRYAEEPPYEVIENDFLSQEELNNIHLVEKALDIYWNEGRCKNVMKDLMIHHELSSNFDFFFQLGEAIQQQVITDVSDYYRIFYEMLIQLGLLNTKRQDSLIYEYVRKYPIRPRVFWPNPLSISQETVFQYFKKNVLLELRKQQKLFIIPYQSGILVMIYEGKEIQYYYAEMSEEQIVSHTLLYKRKL